VKFTNDPRVESALRKRADEDVFVTDLHVSDTCPKATYLWRPPDSPEITVMNHPAHCCWLAIQPRDLDELARIETVPLGVRDKKLRGMRTTEGLLAVVEVDMEGSWW